MPDVYCAHCGQERSAQAQLCPNCGDLHVTTLARPAAPRGPPQPEARKRQASPKANAKTVRKEQPREKWANHKWVDDATNGSEYCFRCGIRRHGEPHPDGINAESIWTLSSGAIKIGRTPHSCVGSSRGFLGLFKVKASTPAKFGWMAKRKIKKARARIQRDWAAQDRDGEHYEREHEDDAD